VSDYSFFSHASAEAGHKTALRSMGIEPLHDLGLRLGEGTGAALTLFLLRSAAAIFNDMATFSSAGVATQSSC
jgi:nicotinate-nucleotide--dimethylbenzimidazole phosphoribosyltransferase